MTSGEILILVMAAAGLALNIWCVWLRLEGRRLQRMAEEEKARREDLIAASRHLEMHRDKRQEHRG